MKVLLDTNIYFALLFDPSALVEQRAMLGRTAPKMFLASVVLAELLQGARGEVARARIRRMVRTLEHAGRVIAPTHDDWARAANVQGAIWDALPSLRNRTLLHDILIVLSARRVGALVVTENRRDFELIAEHVVHVHCSLEELGAHLSD